MNLKIEPSKWAPGMERMRQPGEDVTEFVPFADPTPRAAVMVETAALRTTPPPPAGKKKAETR